MREAELPEGATADMVGVPEDAVAAVSRGGIVSFGIAMAVFLYVLILSVKKNRRYRVIFAFIMVGLLIFLMLVWIGPEQFLARFGIVHRIIHYIVSEKAILNELRPQMWKNTLEIVKDFPVFGTGLGTFSCIFAKYRTFSYVWGFLVYAHNDYIQLVSETGLFGVLSILCFFIWYFRRFRECLKRLRRYN